MKPFQCLSGCHKRWSRFSIPFSVGPHCEASAWSHVDFAVTRKRHVKTPGHSNSETQSQPSSSSSFSVQHMLALCKSKTEESPLSTLRNRPGVPWFDLCGRAQPLPTRQFCFKTCQPECQPLQGSCSRAFFANWWLEL